MTQGQPVDMLRIATCPTSADCGPLHAASSDSDSGDTDQSADTHGHE
jgi:hypothetical protein